MSPATRCWERDEAYWEGRSDRCGLWEIRGLLTPPWAYDVRHRRVSRLCGKGLRSVRTERYLTSGEERYSRAFLRPALFRSSHSHSERDAACE